MTAVGILGGGQLALMLAESALRLGLDPHVYSESLDCPALQVCGAERVHGTLAEFFAAVDTVVFENEFVDCDALEAATRGLPLRFAPSLDAIRVFQDKWKQKEFLIRHAVPTSSAELITPEQAPAHPERVLKWSRQGYDGKGVRLPGAVLGAEEFMAAAQARRIPVYAEDRVEFTRELALVAGRGASGEFVAYPLVISEQSQGICKRVFGPAIHFGVHPELERRAQAIARTVAERSGITGIFAVEFFETPEGELLVNEIAPRVHNSGHYSQDACRASQFEMHWRLTALPGKIPPVELLSPVFAMLNLLGPAGVFRPVEEPALPLPAGARLHWYAKAETRPGRKLGHINCLAAAAAPLEAKLADLSLWDAQWAKSLASTQS